MTDDGLTIELGLPDAAELGDVVVAQVTVANRGEAPLDVSGRLHPAEGDLAFVVGGPYGEERTVWGRYPLDVPPRRVALEPGQALAAGVAVLLAGEEAGGAFDQPGVYRVSARYSPGPGLPDVVSEPRRLVLTLSRRDAAPMADAFALGDVDPGSADDAALVEGGAVAALISAASAARRGGGSEDLRSLVSGLPEDEAGWLVTAALPPAAAEDDPLVVVVREVFAGRDSPGAQRAVQMVQRAPVSA